MDNRKLFKMPVLEGSKKETCFTVEKCDCAKMIVTY